MCSEFKIRFDSGLASGQQRFAEKVCLEAIQSGLLVDAVDEILGQFCRVVEADTELGNADPIQSTFGVQLKVRPRLSYRREVIHQDICKLDKNADPESELSFSDRYPLICVSRYGSSMVGWTVSSVVMADGADAQIYGTGYADLFTFCRGNDEVEWIGEILEYCEYRERSVC